MAFSRAAPTMGAEMPCGLALHRCIACRCVAQALAVWEGAHPVQASPSLFAVRLLETVQRAGERCWAVCRLRLQPDFDCESAWALKRL